MPNWTVIASTWRQWRSQALTWWERISQDEWDEVNGDREKLYELLQDKYGWTRDQAAQEVTTRFDEYASIYK